MQGKYTVKVATFTGQNVLLTRKVIDQMEKGKTLNLKSKLVDAAEKAHKLTEALRAKGVQAYEFHDRASSIVTIGSFDRSARRNRTARSSSIPRSTPSCSSMAPSRSIAAGPDAPGRQTQERSRDSLRRAAFAGRSSAPLDRRRLRTCRRN